MPYDKTKDPFVNDHAYGTLNSVGTKGEAVNAAAGDMAKYSRITVFGGGAITVLPARNADGETITFTPPNGWVSPWLVRQVTAIAGGTFVFTVA